MERKLFNKFSEFVDPPNRKTTSQEQKPHRKTTAQEDNHTERRRYEMGTSWEKNFIGRQPHGKKISQEDKQSFGRMTSQEQDLTNLEEEISQEGECIERQLHRKESNQNFFGWLKWQARLKYPCPDPFCWFVSSTISTQI